MVRESQHIKAPWSTDVQVSSVVDVLRSKVAIQNLQDRWNLVVFRSKAGGRYVEITAQCGGDDLEGHESGHDPRMSDVYSKSRLSAFRCILSGGL